MGKKKEAAEKKENKTEVREKTVTNINKNLEISFFLVFSSHS